MKYILNSAVITTPGQYSYRLIGVYEAQRWLANSGFESTIGYQETCDALEKIKSIRVYCKRRMVKMKTGDEALGVRLTCRMQDPSLKGKIKNPEFILQNCEIGLLKKEA